MPSFELIHLELTEFSNIFEPNYGFDQHFSTFEDTLEENNWNELEEGEPCPTNREVNSTPLN